MPPKTNKKKEKKNNQPKDEEMPKSQTEGSTQEAVEEKSSAVMNEPPMVKKSKDELWDECVLLQEEVERVQKQKKHFKLERDKAQRSWENSKRNLEETKARMKERLRLKQEAKKRCQAEFDEHKEKLRQLEATQHVEVGELKMATIATASKTQKEHVQSDVNLQRKMCNLQTDKREKECNGKIYMEKLKQKQHEELKKLHESYKNKIGEMEAQYDSKKKILVRENNDEIQIEFKKIDERMKIRTETVVEEQSKIWEQINYIIRDRRYVIEIQRQQGRVVAGKELNKRLDRRLEVAAQKNTRLRESLREQRAKLCGSRQQLVVERKAMAKSVKSGNKLCAQILHERRELNLKHQQLELKHEQVQKEYDELQRKQTEAILDAQQKSGLKELLLERKITAVTETLEKEQLKLWVALAFGQGDQTAATHIKELFESKDIAIKALKEDVSRDLKEYDNLVNKVKASGTSVSEQLPRGEIRASIRNASENFDNVMQELKTLRVSEEKETPAGPSLNSELSGSSGGVLHVEP